jgi:hypothetical protein
MLDVVMIYGGRGRQSRCVGGRRAIAQDHGEITCGHGTVAEDHGAVAQVYGDISQDNGTVSHDRGAVAQDHGARVRGALFALVLHIRALPARVLTASVLRARALFATPLNTRTLYTPTLLTAVLVVLCAGCEESLPPRVDPVEVLHPDVRMVGSTISLIGYDHDTLFTGGNVRLSLTNVYDEVLSEDALIRATVTLHLKEKPDSVRTLRLGLDNLVAPPGFFGPVLTIGVHESVELLAVWDQRTDNGTPFWTFPQYHIAYDSKGRPYYQSDTISMVATTSMQVFERVQPLEIIQREMPVVYELYFIEPPPPPN